VPKRETTTNREQETNWDSNAGKTGSMVRTASSPPNIGGHDDIPATQRAQFLARGPLFCRRKAGPAEIRTHRTAPTVQSQYQPSCHRQSHPIRPGRACHPHNNTLSEEQSEPAAGRGPVRIRPDTENKSRRGREASETSWFHEQDRAQPETAQQPTPAKQGTNDAGRRSDLNEPADNKPLPAGPQPFEAAPPSGTYVEEQSGTRPCWRTHRSAQ
jgi:hypothetical protein